MRQKPSRIQYRRCALRGQSSLESMLLVTAFISLAGIFLTFVKAGFSGYVASSSHNLGQYYIPETSTGIDKKFSTSTMQITVSGKAANGSVKTTRRETGDSFSAQTGNITLKF